MTESRSPSLINAQTNTTSLDESYRVEFYPSHDDLVYVISRVQKSAKTASPTTTYSYYLFLIINVIFFPTYLWINDLFFIGIAIFSINLILVLFLLPQFVANDADDFYKNVYGYREKELAVIELTNAGLEYSSDQARSFFPWNNILDIEETDEAIFFFVRGSGFAARKSGFAYDEDRIRFVNFAKSRIENNVEMPHK